jgi:hypothetical protein
MDQILDHVEDQISGCLEEVAIECNPNNIFQKNLNQFRWRNIIHIPYFPAFHRPGWMLRYLLGPFDLQWVELLFSDFWAGITVSLTELPQVSCYYNVLCTMYNVSSASLITTNHI